jgi:NADH dehydrogenase FAD-containing subunit
MSETRPSVAVIGGGYGGYKVAKALDGVADVTLVDPSDAFLHNVASWRALVEPHWLDRIFFPYDRLLHRGRFLRDRAVEVDGRRVTLASGTQLEPDYLVLATGSYYPTPAKWGEADAATARAGMRATHEQLRDAQRVLVIGAGPAGLELAGEIKATFPEKRVTVADRSPDVLAGPFDQELREELRRQLDKLGVDLVLGSPLRGLPEVEPGTAGSFSVTTEAGEELAADIWFRCFGVVPALGYLRGALAEARNEAGYLRVDDQLRVHGQDRVFAIGDISDAEPNMAGLASFQADFLAENLKALVTGEGEPGGYQIHPPIIAVPLGPEGGAGQLPGVEGVAGPELIATVKGRAMLVDLHTQHFDAPPKAA